MFCRLIAVVLLFADVGILRSANAEAPASYQQRVDTVLQTPGCVAFWDFVKREPDGEKRFVAHVPAGSPTNYPLDAANYVRALWGEGREARYDDFPLSDRGPFGAAVRIRKEADKNFRPYLFVPRSRLHETPLDIKGEGKSVSVVVWAIRESGNHALAGIWHEGTDLKKAATTDTLKVERGQRQYALFAGLAKPGTACGHVSENGAGSFRYRYALHKCHSAGAAPQVSGDAPAETLDRSWQCLAMTFDDETDELTGWLNGVAGERWVENPAKDGQLSNAYNAYMQAHYARTPGMQPGEDNTFPADQHYLPPEREPLAVRTIREGDGERVEHRDYRYTRVEVTLRDDANGQPVEVSRDLVGLRKNPWWYPHGIYEPKGDDTGGPFTIGRVIHSSRSVGFTGWIGGVAVFDQALTAAQLQALSELRTTVLK